MGADALVVASNHSVKWQWPLQGQERIKAKAFFASGSPLLVLPLLVCRSHDHRPASSPERVVGAITLSVMQE